MLLNVWKSQNSDTHPTKWTRRNETDPERRTRAADTNLLNEAHVGKILTSTFINDAAKIWNNAPECIKLSKTVYSAKKNIKMYTATLPI